METQDALSVRPLNPRLFAAATRRFGRVIIANEGEGFIATRANSVVRGRPVSVITSAGEYYRVCCPHCNDSRFRLWINHMWGVWSDATQSNNQHLVICYNEDCFAHPARRQQLEIQLYGAHSREQRHVRVAVGDQDAGTLRAVEPPGKLLQVHRLPAQHRAVMYLRERGFDVQELGEVYGVAYCIEASPMHPMATDRIVAPITRDGMLIGWQCRYIGELDWKTTGVKKYYNRRGLPRRLTFYNYDTARQYSLAVIVEGIADAWAVGPQAIAVLGSSVAYMQKRLLHATWQAGTVVIMFDEDAYEESTVPLVAELEGKFAGGVIPVRLPPGKDPGDFSREMNWSMIRAAMADRGMQLVRSDNV